MGERRKLIMCDNYVDEEQLDKILLEMQLRYDKAFEDLANILGLKCWTGCKICFSKDNKEEK